MEETIQICKDQAVLNEFLKKHEGELMDMMDYLYNDEIIMRNHDAQLIRDSELRGEARGISIGRQEGQNDLLIQMIAKGIISPEQAAQFKTV